MLQNTLVIYLISGFAAIFVGLVLFVGYLQAKKSAKKISYVEQLEDLQESVEVEESKSVVTKWNEYWNRIFFNLGMSRYAGDNARGGIDVLLVAIVLGVISGILLKNALSGALIAVIAIAAAGFLLKNVSNKRSTTISKQLPGFIFALKANVEARNPPEQAFLNVVEDIPEPLYDEVIVVKQGLMAQKSFTESLIDLRDTTSSGDLKFLSACIMQATESGGDIRDQLITIQSIIERQQEVNDEINRGYKTASPVMKVATVLIPGSLVAMILLDSNARDFWFQEPLSWILFIIVVVLWGVGMTYSRNLVEKLRKL